VLVGVVCLVSNSKNWNIISKRTRWQNSHETDL